MSHELVYENRGVKTRLQLLMKTLPISDDGAINIRPGDHP